MKRWSLCWEWMSEDPEGDYVLHEDAEAENAALRARIAELESIRADRDALYRDLQTTRDVLREFAGYGVYQQAQAAIVRIAELEAEQAWRPIESAPKDGTSILVYCTDGEVYTTMFSGGRTWAGLDRSSRPLFWMPLPKGPEE